MPTMIIWMLGIALSVSALVTTAAHKFFLAHMAMSAAISILIALASFAEVRAMTDKRTASHGVDVALRHMGMIWAWGALSIVATYAFDILVWRDWWQYFLIFFVMSGLSLFLSATLRKDADAGNVDSVMLSVARGYSVFILLAMVITMVGLLIDGKMWRFTVPAGLRIGSQDWAANNVFFFGAMALAAVSWHAISLLGWCKREKTA